MENDTQSTPYSSSSPGGGPEGPTIVIRPRRGWLQIDWGDIWHHRQLFYFLTWRDIKARYKQTVLGAVWAVVPAFFQMVIYTLIFGHVAGIGEKMEPEYSRQFPYPVFVLAGLILWTFFVKAVSLASDSLVSQAGIVTKVYFPRLILPAAVLGAPLIDFLVGMGFYATIFGYYLTTSAYVVWPGLSLLMLPVLLMMAIMTALGIGTFLGSFIVVYRDFRMIVAHILHLWMYLTPVVYPVTALKSYPQLQWILKLNPMTGILSAWRSVLLSRPLDWEALGISLAISSVLFLCGIYMFRRTERRFADIA